MNCKGKLISMGTMVDLMRYTHAIKIRPQKTSPQIDPSERYDYTSAGAYFITIVTYQRECLFGEIVDGEMVLNDYGLISRRILARHPRTFPKR